MVSVGCDGSFCSFSLVLHNIWFRVSVLLETQTVSSFWSAGILRPSIFCLIPLHESVIRILEIDSLCESNVCFWWESLCGEIGRCSLSLVRRLLLVVEGEMAVKNETYLFFWDSFASKSFLCSPPTFSLLSLEIFSALSSVSCLCLFSHMQWGALDRLITGGRQKDWDLREGAMTLFITVSVAHKHRLWLSKPSHNASEHPFEPVHFAVSIDEHRGPCAAVEREAVFESVWVVIKTGTAVSTIIGREGVVLAQLCSVSFLSGLNWGRKGCQPKVQNRSYSLSFCCWADSHSALSAWMFF